MEEVVSNMPVATSAGFSWLQCVLVRMPTLQLAMQNSSEGVPWIMMHLIADLLVLLLHACRFCYCTHFFSTSTCPTLPMPPQAEQLNMHFISPHKYLYTDLFAISYTALDVSDSYSRPSSTHFILLAHYYNPGDHNCNRHIFDHFHCVVIHVFE